MMSVPPHTLGRTQQVSLRTPVGVIEKGSLAILDFNKGAEVWQYGYNATNVNVTTFDFCL